MPTRREPSYKLVITLRSRDQELQDVISKIYLPERATGRVDVKFFPQKHAWDIKDFVGEISFYSQPDSTSTRLRSIIGRGRAKSIDTKGWLGTLSETEMEIETEYLEIEESIHKQERRSISFWLTPSFFLEPLKLFVRRRSGATEISWQKHFNFQLRDGSNILFDTTYKHLKRKNNVDLSFPELVGYCDNYAIGLPTTTLLDALNDFLLLVSFAERRRIICTGWYESENSVLKTVFKRDIAIPKQAPRKFKNEMLVDISNKDEYLATAHKKFINSKKEPLLTQALQKVINRQRSLESYYLSLFSALETLLDAFVGDSSILQKSDWKMLRRAMTKLVQCQGSYGIEKQKLILENLPGLNRKSFASRCERLCEILGFEIDDLWPVMDSSGGPSLYRIRNLLAHGVHIAPKMYKEYM